MLQGIFDKLTVFGIVQSSSEQTILPQKGFVINLAHDLTHIACIYPYDHIILVFEMIVEGRLRHTAVIRYIGYRYLVDAFFLSKLQKGFGKKFLCCFPLHNDHP